MSRSCLNILPFKCDAIMIIAFDWRSLACAVALSAARCFTSFYVPSLARHLCLCTLDLLSFRFAYSIFLEPKVSEEEECDT